MDGAALHEVTVRTALALPAVEETQPFGEESVVFKVVGKMFVLLTELRGVPIVNLKCAPRTAPRSSATTPRCRPAGT